MHGERVDWGPRLEIILRHGPRRPFDPFGREAPSSGRLPVLLDEFRAMRHAKRCITRDMLPTVPAAQEGVKKSISAAVGDPSGLADSRRAPRARDRRIQRILRAVRPAAFYGLAKATVADLFLESEALTCPS